jgi:hypothetical protein
VHEWEKGDTWRGLAGSKERGRKRLQFYRESAAQASAALRRMGEGVRSNGLPMPHFRSGTSRRALALSALLGIAFPFFTVHPSAAQQRNGGGNGNRGGNNGVVRGNGTGGSGAAGTGTGTGGSGTGGSGTGGSGTGGSSTLAGGTGGGANGGAGGSADDASCMPSAGPEECQDRCPSFDTCTVLTSRGDLDHLYFKLDDQLFQCDGLDCNGAAQSLDDYCCQRGEFAPSKDGGCTLPGGVSAALGGEGGTGTRHALLGVCATLLAGALALRRRGALK